MGLIIQTRKYIQIGEGLLNIIPSNYQHNERYIDDLRSFNP